MASSVEKVSGGASLHSMPQLQMDGGKEEEEEEEWNGARLTRGPGRIISATAKQSRLVVPNVLSTARAKPRQTVKVVRCIPKVLNA